MMSLPRVLHLDPDGTLRMQILPRFATLRSTSLVRPASSGSEIKITLQKASGEVLCTASRRTEAFEFLIQSSIDNRELLHVVYAPEKHAFIADGKKISLEENDTPQLHVYVDGSVIELILGQRVGYTRRFYYSQTMAPDITVRISGGTGAGITANAWGITPISNNRLTAPATMS
jgi:beta-fructofuranosidase